jgi:hypothetical protein
MERHARAAFSWPVAGKVMDAAFDGGRLTSDAGVLVLAKIDRRLGIAQRLAGCITDLRAPGQVRHGIAEMIRFRVLLIAAGYPDANDCDALRTDPAFKMAVGRLPASGADLCSQPTMSRLENLPTATALKRMMAAMVGLFCDSFEQVPRRIVLDIDDTEDRVHGGQALALFHAHYGGRCFLPIHVYEAVTGKPVAVVLRPGKTPDGTEVMLVLRHVIRAIRARWPRVDILVRGDSHYGRPEAMSWCERERVAYLFGLAGNKVLLRRVAGLAEAVALERVEGGAAKVRRYDEFRYAAETWHVERRVIARVEASEKGAETAGSWSPTSPARRAGSTRPSTVQGARRKIWSRHTRSTSPRTGPRAARPPRINSAWCCTLPRTGSCTPCAAWRRSGQSGVTPSSTRSA